jgi:HD-GYP domain-containing protein (c-di-GMP phosphodiesterase class II)
VQTATRSRKSNRLQTPPEQAKALATVLREEFNVGFAFYDAATGEQVSSDEAPAPGPPGLDLSAEAVLRLAAGEATTIQRLPGPNYQISILLYHEERPSLLAVSILPGMAQEAAAQTLELARLRKWLQSFSERLRLAGLFNGQRRQAERDDAQARTAWESMLTLDQLMRRLRTHKEPAGNQRLILHTAQKILPVEMLAWVPGQATQAALCEGEPILSAWDCRQFATLLGQQPEAENNGIVLCNEARETSWGSRYPQVENLLALPLGEKGANGWVLALNKRPGPAGARSDNAGRTETGAAAPFRRSDAALLMPFAGLLDLHVRFARRYGETRELLIGLTRSLTAAIDAKDSFTYGHSERVARIAVELGQEMALPEEELSDIYLAGLLHDIGKIGISDAILRKREALTADEFEQIKQHVTIGYKILADLRPIRNLLPGVLYHHERMDGRGYPHGLAGAAIPQLARILAVADGFDAMSNLRPYRAALPLARVEEILKAGAGSQWDARVIEAYQRCREKIHLIRQRGVGESLCHALDGALRADQG